MKRLIYCFLLLFPLMSFSQQQELWKLINTYENENIDTWDVNPIGQVILSSKSKIFLLDTSFQVQFTQSNSIFSSISKIDASHSLKTLIFSEDDQMIGVLDNSLTFQEGKMYLPEYDISYATNVCYSNQSKRLWVYDEDNSRLICFQGVSSSQKQTEISNLSSFTRNLAPTSLLEKNQKLFLFYKGDGIFIFDYYGSFIRKYEQASARQIYPTERYLYLLVEDTILRIDRDTQEIKQIKLPYLGIEEFRVSGNFVFFKDEEGIKKYHLKQD